LLGVVTVGVARFFGKSGSRASIGVSIATRWLAVYVLWGFAGGLALTLGMRELTNGGVQWGSYGAILFGVGLLGRGLFSRS